jgi:YHS domain-containing protein
MKKILAMLLFPVITIGIASAQDQTGLRKKLYNLDETGLAIKGFDPVSYFTAQKAIAGKEEFTQTYQGVTYHFASAQDRDLFKGDPAKYQPQYGGWCAYAMGATGEKVDIDPKTFELIDGKLYLFYNAFFNNTKKTWDKDKNNLKTKADVNWAKIYR